MNTITFFGFHHTNKQLNLAAKLDLIKLWSTFKFEEFLIADASSNISALCLSGAAVGGLQYIFIPKLGGHCCNKRLGVTAIADL